MKVLTLRSLAQGMPGLTPAQGAVMAEACTICLERAGHDSCATLRVDGAYTATFDLSCLECTDQMRRAYGFDTRFIDQGACGVSILVVSELTGYEVLEEAARGTYFDYWLAPKGSFLFQGSARLESSGILDGTEEEIRRRANDKLDRFEHSTSTLPAFVVIVEFGRPLARILLR